MKIIKLADFYNFENASRLCFFIIISKFLLFYFSAPGHKSNGDRCVYMPVCHCSGGGNYRHKEKYRWYVIKD